MSRSEILNFRVTPAEKQRLQREAADAGYKSVGDYVRLQMLGAEETPSTTYSALNGRMDDLEASVLTLARSIQDRHFGDGKRK